VKLLKKFTITDISATRPYLVRWSLRLPLGWSLKLHHVVRPDGDRCEHDHPWFMLRVILRGGYLETRAGKPVFILPWRPWAPWRVYWSGGAFRHRIMGFMNGRDSWSLVLCGSKAREWGFFTRSGWVPWRTFVNALRGDRVAWCEDGSSVSPDGPVAVAVPLVGVDKE
jgi:hypothetical protein